MDSPYSGFKSQGKLKIIIVKMHKNSILKMPWLNAC